MITIVDKKELRKNAFKVREELALSGSNAIKSSNIVSKILNSSDFKNSNNIALYYPIKNEIDITSILKVKNKNFYLPICKDNDLFFVKYIDEDNLITGAYNIKEPKGEIINPEILDLIYIPALMANRAGYRLGYGKGFYDRFFANNKIKAKKVIVLASELINDAFKENNFDYKCDEIITA